MYINIICIFFIIFTYVCVWVTMCAYALMCAGTCGGQERVFNPWSRSCIWLWVTQCGCWESNLSPLQVLLTAEPFPSPTFLLLTLYFRILVPPLSFNCILMDINHYVADVYNVSQVLGLEFLCMHRYCILCVHLQSTNYTRDLLENGPPLYWCEVPGVAELGFNKWSFPYIEQDRLFPKEGHMDLWEIVSSDQR